jgi:hypothetical protein
VIGTTSIDVPGCIVDPGLEPLLPTSLLNVNVSVTVMGTSVAAARP